MENANTESVTLAVEYFDIDKIADSGQCFRWQKISHRKYLVPSGNTCAIIEQAEYDDEIHLTIEAGTLPYWQNYFNIGERYTEIISRAIDATLSNGEPDNFLQEAARDAAGVQILTQNLWETLVSFMVSQNNNIPRIKKLIEALCSEFGDLKELGGHRYHTFPTAERLAGMSLGGFGLGYRDKYIERLVENVESGAVDLHELEAMETETARTYLKGIYGIGDKVADCVLLFGLHRTEAFPVDTWIHKVIETEYAGKFPVEHYAGYAGIIQQFIFYYMQKRKDERHG